MSAKKWLGVNKPTVRAYLDKIIGILEHMEQLHTPAYDSWLEEYDRGFMEKYNYRRYKTLDEFFEDQKTNITLIYEKLRLEKLKCELWQCLHFGMTPEEWEKQKRSLFPVSWYRHTIVYGGYVFFISQWSVGVERDVSPRDMAGKGKDEDPEM